MMPEPIPTIRREPSSRGAKPRRDLSVTFDAGIASLRPIQSRRSCTALRSQRRFLRWDFGILLSALLSVLPVHAAESPPSTFDVRAGGPSEAIVADAISFDASASTLPDSGDRQYLWSFGDGARDSGERVTHAYTRPGTYAVTLSVTAGGTTRESTTTARIYRTEHLLLTDGTASSGLLDDIRRSAADEGVLVSVLNVPSGTNSAEEIARQTLERRRSLERAPLLLVLTAGTTATDVLSNIGQLVGATTEQDRRALGFERKGVVIATDQPFPLIARPAQTAFNVLRPQYILLTRPSALPDLARARTADGALEAVRGSGAAFTILGPHSERAVTRLTAWNALSYVVNALVNAGVPTSGIALILMLPIVATILAFSRQVIGIKAFGMFTPAAVTLSFIAIGLKYGLVIFAVVLLTATLSRFILRRFRLLYLPRMAIVLTAVSLSIFGLFALGAHFDQTGILSFSIFPILVLASLAEQFVEAQIRLGIRTAARLTAETLLLSVVSTLIVQWDVLRSLIIGFPELILLTIPLNILLGRWTGLRLTEYIRFRKLLLVNGKHAP
jgi:PKD repeat protein